jgi:hypothetical protein
MSLPTVYQVKPISQDLPRNATLIPALPGNSISREMVEPSADHLKNDIGTQL